MTLQIIQFSSDAKVEGNTLTGIAHVFGKRAKVGGRYEEFSPGAFKDALRNSDVRAFLEHDRSKLLGRQSSGTLTVNETDVGLEYSLDLPNTSYANDLRELVNRGDLTEMSFGFIPGKVSWARADDGLQVRNHTNVSELVDISPVALPAFDGTSLQLRSFEIEPESIASQVIRARLRVTQKEFTR